MKSTHTKVKRVILTPSAENGYHRPNVKFECIRLDKIDGEPVPTLTSPDEYFQSVDPYDLANWCDSDNQPKCVSCGRPLAPEALDYPEHLRYCDVCGEEKEMDSRIGRNDGANNL